jgi:hypothetical protein
MANAGQLDPLLAREVKAAGSARPFIVRVSSDEEAIEGKARHTLRCNNIENGVALQPLRWEWDQAQSGLGNPFSCCLGSSSSCHLVVPEAN